MVLLVASAVCVGSVRATDKGGVIYVGVAEIGDGGGIGLCTGHSHRLAVVERRRRFRVVSTWGGLIGSRTTFGVVVGLVLAYKSVLCFIKHS